MPNSLVIVESPAKAKTIKKYLGKGYSIMASVGHVVDLPERELGVDVKEGFAPKYVVIRGKSKVLKQITEAAKKSQKVYLAPDPDREGEAISWHLADRIKKSIKQSSERLPVIHRVLFNEITADAVRGAIASPTELNQNLFEAQQARRILDRLVGYKVSPLLWEKVQRGLSAGRVQTVAVRMVCEREEEIAAFVSQEYWSIVARLEGSIPPPFEAKLIKIAGKDAEIKDETAARSIVEELGREKFLLVSIKKSERRRRPTPPFITSKLQQDAARKLGFTAKRTMALAQMLYEGVEIGGDGLVGLITYMRTDSVRVSEGALAAVRDFIRAKYGSEYLPEGPIRYAGKRGAQDAHEAIRPTSLEYPPERVEPFLDHSAFRLYELIWKRFVASQMNPAVYDQTTFDIKAGRFGLRATGQLLKFPGFMAVYLEGEDEVVQKDEEENPTLPDLTEGEVLKTHETQPHQHFTQPPPRFTEATLIKELEEKGIGRPSTYASIMSVIQEKHYAQKVEKRFQPTDLGKLVNTLLVKSFPDVFDIGFTAQMENELDDVEEGRRHWVEALKDFYGPFDKALNEAKHKMLDVKRQVVPTEFSCEKCDSPMVIRWGRHGEFLACSAYPGCRTTREFTREANGSIKIKESETTGEKCEVCGSPMVVRHGRFGQFLSCARYPECKTTRSISTGVACPDCGNGKLVQKRSRKGGRVFYGCNRYPDCKFAIWDKPIEGTCPECGGPILVEKYSSRTSQTTIACPKKGCPYRLKKE